MNTKLRGSAKAKVAIGVLGAFGFVIGAIVAFRSDAATALLGVSAAIIVVAYLGDRFERFTVKHGDTELSGEISKAMRDAREATDAAESAVEEAVNTLQVSDNERLSDFRAVVLQSLNRSLEQLQSASEHFERLESTVVSASLRLDSPMSVLALKVFLDNAPDNATAELDTSDSDNPMLKVVWPRQ